MKSWIRTLGFALVLSTAVLAVGLFPNPAAGKSLTPDQVLEKIFDNFRKQNIKSMMYDELRTVSTKVRGKGGRQGMMMLDKENATTYTMRYFYSAPDKHGYRMLSDPIEGFWPGDPNQENNIAMDERWLEKVRESYEMTLSEDAMVEDRLCYVLNLTPKKGLTHVFPMTWYIDKKKFLILKLYHLVRVGRQTKFTSGVITYDHVSGRLMPIHAEWLTTMKDLPYQIEYKVKYKNYKFNVPLDDSVFEVEPVPPPKIQNFEKFQ